MKKETALVKRMKAAASQIKFADPEQVKQWEATRKMITESVREVKKDIADSLPPQEQETFYFMPTSLTRTSPFFPLNSKELSNRSKEDIIFDHSWGKITIKGERLGMFDETVLLTLLLLALKNDNESYLTTQYQICKLGGVAFGNNTYNAIWNSIERLANTSINLATYKDKRKKIAHQFTGNILICGHRDPGGKIKIVFNPYFMQMYADGIITRIDFKFRASLKGDIARALYRFFISQRDAVTKYPYPLLNLCAAVNINKNLPIIKKRYRIRTGLRELRKKGFLTRWTLTKKDMVSVVRIKKSIDV